MIPSIIVRTTERGLFSMLLLVSWWLLLRGHNEPGGGFVGGLFAAAAYALRIFAWGTELVEREFRIPWETIGALGVFVAAATGLLGPMLGDAYLKSRFVELDLQPLGILSLTSSLVFEAGVYLCVWGGLTAVIVRIARVTAAR